MNFIAGLRINQRFALLGVIALVAVAAHVILDFSWIQAGLVGAAIAPTDPAVTFSVFGAREIRGRAGTILEGEAGMNDPVGIALMIGMVELERVAHDRPSQARSPSPELSVRTSGPSTP